MIKITGYDVTDTYTRIHWEQDVYEGMMGPVIFLGFLEQYMGAYGTSYEDTIDYLLADPLYDDIDVPPMDDPEADTKIAELLKRVGGRIEWAVDKAQMLADMSLADDTAESMRASWKALREQVVAESPLSYRDALVQRGEAQSSYADGHQRRQEELLADEMMEAYKPASPVILTNLLPPEAYN